MYTYLVPVYMFCRSVQSRLGAGDINTDAKHSGIHLVPIIAVSTSTQSTLSFVHSGSCRQSCLNRRRDCWSSGIGCARPETALPSASKLCISSTRGLKTNDSFFGTGVLFWGSSGECGASQNAQSDEWFKGIVRGWDLTKSPFQVGLQLSWSHRY